MTTISPKEPLSNVLLDLVDVAKAKIIIEHENGTITLHAVGLELRIKNDLIPLYTLDGTGEPCDYQIGDLLFEIKGDLQKNPDAVRGLKK